MNEQTQKKPCSKCGKPVINTGNGWMHEGGGMYEQVCKNCGWRGGQQGSFQSCPSCGKAEALIDDHVAS